MIIKIIFFSLAIISTLQKIICDERAYIDPLVCSKIDNVKPRWSADFALQNFLRCEIRNLNSKSSKSIIGKVEKQSYFDVDTSNIELVKIETKGTSVRFVPAGMKKRFPKVMAVEIFDSGLTHLEREDMRQLGDDLQYFGLWHNPLATLPGDLFDFNPI